MWAAIFIGGALSSVPMRSVVFSGVSSRRLKSGEPQSPQKKRCSVRPLSAVLVKRLGVPCVMRNPELGSMAFTEPPAPEAQQATPEKKEMVRSRADEAAVMCSTNAKVASEMIGAIWVMKNDGPGVINDVANGDWTRINEHTDAMTLVYMLGIDEDTALSTSGQELIENKISAVNGL